MTRMTKTTTSKEVVGQGKKEKESNLSELAKTVLNALEPVYEKMREKLEDKPDSESLVDGFNKMFYYWTKLVSEKDPEVRMHIAKKLAEKSVNNSIALTEIRASEVDAAPDQKSSNIVQNYFGRINVLTKDALEDAKEVLGQA
ncbi:hypothetical protein GF354_01410 [Candidatus Peregrinibacteria bacterium]|nr:hypothetical protein [Candidatus Peregrinibacteria bacterium]